ncbi:MAG: carboxypeptidase-like regulatory domain-containing protein, partial [Terriglobia bacterium]
MYFPSARAQVTGATLSGTVTDPSGAVIPHAKISIKNTATGVTRNSIANSAGL